MFRSLRIRLFATHALALLVTLAVLVALMAHQQRRWLEARQVETLERAARLAARELSVDPRARAGAWSDLAREIAGAYRARVTLIEGGGRVIGDSEVEAERLPEVENHRGRPEVRAALAGRDGHAIRHSATVGTDYLYLAIPARVGPLAVVRLAEPLTELARLDATLLQASAAAALATLLVGLALAYWLTGRHASRIRDLERVAQRIGKGERVRALERPGDEIGHLGRALNDMAGELRARLEALERERDARERILAHMSDGVGLLDLEGRVLHMNHSLATLLDAPRPAPAGTRFQEVARVPELEELMRRARASGASAEAEIRLWLPHQRLVRVTVTPLGRGEGSALLVVLHDLTEAETLNRVRQDFVANVSHELRTPLTSLRGYAETLLGGGLDDRENRERFVEIIRDQTVRLQALVEDLLSLAELERPGARLRLERFDLRELLEAQVATSRARAEAARLRIDLEGGPPVVLQADRSRIEQVVANLIDNALKYTDEGGVRLRAGDGGGVAWVEVEDTGPGIPPEDQPRIFERFYRVDKARSRQKGGTGLGLSIVKHIVTLHGGHVAVESAPGRGSRFRFVIPRT